jgi:hypothetical protein
VAVWLLFQNEEAKEAEEAYYTFQGICGSCCLP